MVGPFAAIWHRLEQLKLAIDRHDPEKMKVEYDSVVRAVDDCERSVGTVLNRIETRVDRARAELYRAVHPEVAPDASEPERRKS